MLAPIALTRSVPPSIANCELTHLEREAIDFERAVREHSGYEESLIALGCSIERLPALPDQPDSVFVEDTAVVLSEIALITRPGAESRRPEVVSVADALRAHRPLAVMEAPGTLDGGDVMVIGSTIYVGESTRTNEEGVRQLRELASAYGYSVERIDVAGCLHLKSAVTQVAEGTVLLNPAFVDSARFERFDQIAVHPNEPLAANALRIGDTVIYSDSYPETRERLEQSGINVRLVETRELQKAEGAVTCCSILIANSK